MGEILEGKVVAAAITEKAKAKAEKIRENNTIPTLAIVRIGENPGDLSYEKSALKTADEVGVKVRLFIFEDSISEEKLIDQIKEINADDSIHGVLMFKPLPKHMDDKKVCETLLPEKDMDGITSGSMAGVFMDSPIGYPPCTAEAVMEMLDFYGEDLDGKKVTIFGRSIVIGRPVAMMAMKENGTVTVCHSRTRTEDFVKAGKEADIVIAALGSAKMVGADKLGTGQIIIDVGINVDKEGKLCGDVDFDEVQETAGKITPVPGGVGSVTTAILMKHVVEAAEKRGVL